MFTFQISSGALEAVETASRSTPVTTSVEAPVPPPGGTPKVRRPSTRALLIQLVREHPTETSTQIVARLRATYGRTADPATVYRVRHAMRKAGEDVPYLPSSVQQSAAPTADGTPPTYPQPEVVEVIKANLTVPHERVRKIIRAKLGLQVGIRTIRLVKFRFQPPKPRNDLSAYPAGEKRQFYSRFITAAEALGLDESLRLIDDIFYKKSIAKVTGVYTPPAAATPANAPAPAPDAPNEEDKHLQLPTDL